MPSATDILRGLETLANQWTVVAVVWHGVLAAAMMAYAAGWRPTRRLSAQLLAVPLASVSVFAWIAGNPFNGAVFAMVAVLSFSIGRRLPPDPGVLAPRWAVAGGLALLAFGWVYPHFLRTEGWLAYGYAAPVGLVPCPTLSVVVGVGLILDGLRSRAWSLAIAATGVTYGAMGWLRLGVAIDVVLLVGAIAMGAMALRRRPGREDARPAAEILRAC